MDFYNEAKNRGGFTKAEMEWMRSEGFLGSGIDHKTKRKFGDKKWDDDLIKPEPPDAYWDAVDLIEKALERFDQEQQAKPYGGLKGIPVERAFRMQPLEGMEAEDLKEYREKEFPRAREWDWRKGLLKRSSESMT